MPTLDSTSSVVKSDNLVDRQLHDALYHSVAKLRGDQAENPSWNLDSHEIVRNLVDPSLCPLVYDETRGFPLEVVGVKGAIARWSGSGEVIPQPDLDDCAPTSTWGHPYLGWSFNYQWLPANLALQDDGSVSFTSYINNLHPDIHPNIYFTIEKLVKKVLPMWDQCLSRKVEVGLETDLPRNLGAGRLGSRFPNPDISRLVVLYMYLQRYEGEQS